MTAGGALAESERPRELGAHQRRGVVEQHDERALGGRAVVRPEPGIKIGAGQSGGGIASLRSGSRARPLQELTNDHAPTDGAMSADACAPMPCTG